MSPCQITRSESLSSEALHRYRYDGCGWTMSAVKCPSRQFVPSPKIPVMGIESEFENISDERVCRPEDMFGAPTTLVPAMPVRWAGKAVPLPHGGVLYFDRGVLEVVTPPLEVCGGAPRSAVGCLWQQIHWVRGHITSWEEQHKRRVRLRGFSAHYNVSYDTRMRNLIRSLDRLSHLLCYILPFPVLMLAANCDSTGVGVRPRRNRVEVTVDFTPDPELMVATAAVVMGIVREVADWRAYALSELSARGLPLIVDFAPKPHTSRNGWLAHQSCFRENPFKIPIDAPMWPTDGQENLTTREVARRVVRFFWPSISRHCDAKTRRHIASVLSGAVTTLIGRPTRPPSYEDVLGLLPERIIRWDRRTYARLLCDCYGGEMIKVGIYTYRPLRILSWFEVEMSDCKTNQVTILTLDQLRSRVSPRMPRSRSVT